MIPGRIKWKKQIMIAGLTLLLNGFSISSSVHISMSHDLASTGFSTQDLECYGFVIPLPAGDDSTYETFLNSRSRCLINDLLRENITVYWSSCDFSAMSQRMQNHVDAFLLFYKKGAFIVPFSGDLHKDTLATTLVYNYNMTSEIDDDLLKLKVYKLLEPVNTTSYVLQEAKICQYLGRPTQYHWPVYLQIAECGGFFTIEFLLDDEVIHLNNNDFNVFMWPYRPDSATKIEAVMPLTNTEGFNAIRRFVRNGGGYIGSCYGAQLATSGNINFKLFNLLRYAYNPDLYFHVPSGFLALSDSLSWYKVFLKSDLHAATVELTNMSHPLTFGLNKTVKDLWEDVGISWVGKNTETLGVYKDLSDKNDCSIGKGFIKEIIGSPAYLSTVFGDGKIVLYMSHPEMINNISLLSDSYTWRGDRYYGRRILHNTLFYVTSKSLESSKTEMHYPVSFIEDIDFKTRNLHINQNVNYEFQDVKTRVIILNKKISELDNISVELGFLISNLHMDITEETRINYMHYFCNIYRDYNNKTLSSLDKLERIYPMLFEYDESILKQVDSLKTRLSWRLNHSEKLIQEVIAKAEGLKDLIKLKNHVIQKPRVLCEARGMLRDFETGLKYIPQTYFEAEKLVRYAWYNYEANTALYNL